MTQFFILMFSTKCLFYLTTVWLGCFTPRLDLVVVGPDWFLASSLTSKPSSIILIIFLDSESPSPWFDGADELVLSSQPLTPSRKLLRVMTFIQLSAPTDEEGPTSRGFGSLGKKGHWGGLANRLVELRVRCMYILVYIMIYYVFISRYVYAYVYSRIWI